MIDPVPSASNIKVNVTIIDYEKLGREITVSILSCEVARSFDFDLNFEDDLLFNETW